MSRYRRLLVLLLGTGACLVLVLQTMDMWSFRMSSTTPRIRADDLPLRTDGLPLRTDGLSLRTGVTQASLSSVSPGLQLVLAVGSQDVKIIQPSYPESFRPVPVQSSNPDSFKSDPVQLSAKSVSDQGPSVQEIIQKANKETIILRNDLKPPKSVLGPEQLLQIMGSAIGGLPVQEPQKVTHILVTTYFRSGSTFLGDILQQNWKTFYHFEPLHHMSDGLRIKEPQVPEALSLLRDLMHCNFSSHEAGKYLLWTSDQKNTFLVRRNRFLWVACRMQPQLCFRPDFVRFVCVRAPWQVMKVNRLNLEQVGKFVLDNPDLDVRVLHLVRDPRGIISSRKILGWCNTTRCSDFRVLCKEMNEDYEVFHKLQSLRPDKFFQLRYEDLSMKPNPVTKEIFSSLGVPFTNTVGKFLKLNTRARPVDAKDPYSTRRDSSKAPFEWRKKIALDEIKKLQMGCSPVLKNYDYHMVNSSKDLSGDPRWLYASDKPWLRT